MFIYSGNRPFSIDFIFDYYPSIDISSSLFHGDALYSIIEKNKNQLSVFEQLQFRDSETKTLLVQGTEEFIRKLEKLKKFLKLSENIKTQCNKKCSNNNGC
jgi:hypothetical protein